MLTYVDKYGNQGDSTSVLAAMDKAATTSWMMNIGAEKGAILERLMDKYQPENVLELGTFLGYSSIRIVRKLPPNGRLITIEKVMLEATMPV